MYGLTECKRVSYLEPELLDVKPTSVGRAIPGTETFVLDEEHRPVAPGETGVLYVRGPHVMAGYWNLPERDRAHARRRPAARRADALHARLLHRRRGRPALPSSAGATTSSRRGARRSARSRSRTRCTAIRRRQGGCRRRRARTRCWARPSAPTSCWRRRDARRARRSSAPAASASRCSWCRATSSCSTSCPRPTRARCARRPRRGRAVSGARASTGSRRCSRKPARSGREPPPQTGRPGGRRARRPHARAAGDGPGCRARARAPARSFGELRPRARDVTLDPRMEILTFALLSWTTLGVGTALSLVLATAMMRRYGPAVAATLQDAYDDYTPPLARHRMRMKVCRALIRAELAHPRLVDDDPVAALRRLLGAPCRLLAGSGRPARFVPVPRTRGAGRSPRGRGRGRRGCVGGRPRRVGRRLSGAPARRRATCPSADLAAGACAAARRCADKRHRRHLRRGAAADDVRAAEAGPARDAGYARARPRRCCGGGTRRPRGRGRGRAAQEPAPAPVASALTAAAVEPVPARRGRRRRGVPGGRGCARLRRGARARRGRLGRHLEREVEATMMLAAAHAHLRSVEPPPSAGEHAPALPPDIPAAPTPVRSARRCWPCCSRRG